MMCGLKCLVFSFFLPFSLKQKLKYRCISFLGVVKEGQKEKFLKWLNDWLESLYEKEGFLPLRHLAEKNLHA